MVEILSWLVVIGLYVVVPLSWVAVAVAMCRLRVPSEDGDQQD